MNQPLKPYFQRPEPRVLAGNRQRLTVFLPVVKQKALITFERCSRDLGWRSDSTSPAPRQKHLHVNATNSESALAETLYGKILQISIQKWGKRTSA
jgi:hypothetical protein